MRRAILRLTLPLPVSLCLVAVPAMSIASSEAAAQDSTIVVLETDPQAVTDPPVNPFDSFQTHHLANGVKLWIRPLPGAVNTSVSVGVPFGSDNDPVGKEGTAHLLEHLLFSDHDGRTEQAIKEDIEGLGGARNGFTRADLTWYFATVEKEHGIFALEWLSRIVSPHALESDLVEKNRQPVALEIRAQPRDLLEHVWAFLDPAWLRPEEFWKREFGLSTPNIRSFDRYASLNAIEPTDLHEFYDRYYAPGAMTVTVVGDVDPDEVLAAATATFGLLRERPVPVSQPALQDPGRHLERHFWTFGPSVSHTARFKVFAPTGFDEVKLLFLQRILERRLNQRLRYGDEKAVYTLGVQYVKRGPAAFLAVSGAIDPEVYDFALRVLEEELELLRSGTMSDETYAADRRAIVEKLRGTNRTAQALNFWTFQRFSDPNTYEDFPNLIGAIEATSKAQLAEFASSTLVRDREVLTITRPHPTSQMIFGGAALLAFWLAVRLLGWSLTRKVNLREIRYIARMRLGPVYRVGLVVVAGGVAAILSRLLYAGFEWIALNYVVVRDSYEIQMASFVGMGALSLTVLILFLSLIPRTVLLFPGSILIKSLTFRSRILEPDDIEYVTWARFPSIWLSRRLLGVTPMLVGIIRKGIYLKPKAGRAYFFRTRNSEEMMELLEEWKPGITVERIPVQPKPVRQEKAKPTREAPSATPDPAPSESKPAPVVQKPKPTPKPTPKQKGPAKPSLDDIDLDAELSAEDLAALGIEAPEPEPDPFAGLEDMIRDMDSESDPPKD